MSNDSEIRKGRHCVFDMHVHLVFVTKYRHKVFTDQHLRALERIFHDVCDDFGCRLEEFNGETDHVHLLVNLTPTTQVSKLVNSLKGVSSRYMRRDYPELAKHYWRAQRLWSGSYYAGTAGGAPLATLRKYIEHQNRPD
ncbi:IS200/IS605 family transposase [Bifidobacterium gallicum]|uniref:Transposase n=1 Tax=Bifidobacterium gallicum DSM 20093 = LMG 11596 TaxID=561180 RepID=D1NU84_9BIFI|nr:IS200/IS605 family transposase [Bifidobacterium gallicum]EFA23288.1 transposase-like protein [Bifidobacterium gallicum DSM 20093 = LMG 11596]KFI58932.1 transposase [Bifidobacterium gallicum DSM 20093 = LMG 11596]